MFLAWDAVRVGEPRADERQMLEVELLTPDRFVQALRADEVASLPAASAVALALLPD